MIKIIDDEFNSFKEFKSFCKNDSFGTRIYSHFLAYGYELNFVDFWVEFREDAIVSAIVSLDGDCVLCLSDLSDFSEISQFVSFMSFKTVTFDMKYKEFFMFFEGQYSCGDILKYNKNVNFSPEYKVVTPDLNDYYMLLKSCESEDFFVPEKMTFLSDTVRRINKGLCEICGIYYDEKLVSCAMTVSQTDFSVILGAVATDKNYRKRGFGGCAVRALAERFVDLENVYIYTTIKRNTCFYENHNFYVDGRWVKYTFGG